VLTGTVKLGTYVASSSLLPYELGGLQVLINDAAAPMLAVVITPAGQSARAQINFQVPLERNSSLLPADQSTGRLLACGANAIPYPSPPLWGGFFADSNGYAVAQHASDYSPVNPSNPARAGETIIAYADDFFAVWPPPPVGFPTPSQPLFQILPSSSQLISSGTYLAASSYLYLQDYPSSVCAIPRTDSCSFTNTPALQVTFEGLAPGQTGVEQINFVIPVNQQPGDWALFFNRGSCPDGSGPPGRCSTNGSGSSSPYVKVPVR
jgi:uncharacterized protein (TIGR03437 family)